ncbi:YigZ family protein [Bacillus fonticola]|uniref:YigZ family protein n=1 Tax=Bacillus fonticola TaxID=2728853 RepID=UPI00147500A5|nr:YigZ family protein [Bacillus fonticola]
MHFHYMTVPSNCTQHEFVVQRSRFIAHVKRATTESEAQAFIAQIKKEHSNASHNCSAYLIGEHDNIQKANDDGEPSGTAGVPILEVLKKRKLKDTVVVITRYFGGIKLGAGGLIRAYGTATSEGIQAAGLIECALKRTISTSVDYTLLGKLENELRHSHYHLQTIDYLDRVTIHTHVLESEVEHYLEWITELTSNQHQTTISESHYVERVLPKE